MGVLPDFFEDFLSGNECRKRIRHFVPVPGVRCRNTARTLWIFQSLDGGDSWIQVGWTKPGGIAMVGSG